MGLIFTCAEVASNIKLYTVFDVHDLIVVPSNGEVDQRIAHHTDLSISVVQDRLFIEPSCYDEVIEKLNHAGYGTEGIHCGKTIISKLYPHDIAYNVLPMKNHLFHKTDYTDAVITKNVNLEAIDVRQGYSRCSVLPVGLNAAITSDEGMFNVLSNHGYKVLKINLGDIELKGFTHGFIGGVGGLVENYMLINGSLKFHRDGEIIKRFIMDQNYEVIELHHGPLEDVGSILYLQR